MLETYTENTKALKGKTIVITGATRGIGRAIALKCAADGANIVIAAKSSEPHPKLPGTIHTVAEEVEAAGGKALAIKLDVRDEENVKAMFAQANEVFGGIDAVINNAGAISLTNVEATPAKKYDLIHSINSRAVYLTAHHALPYLKKSSNPHILSLSPPLNLGKNWLGPYIPYTTSKYGMTLLSLGMAEEFRSKGIAVNTLWPRTMISTAAIEFVIGSNAFAQCRKPEVMADAAYAVLCRDAKQVTGQNFIDDDVLTESGVTNLAPYAFDEKNADNLQLDLFVD